MPDNRSPELVQAIVDLEYQWEQFTNTDTLDLEPLGGAIQNLINACPGPDDIVFTPKERVFSDRIVQKMFDEALDVTQLTNDPFDETTNFRYMASVMASYVLSLAGRVPTK